MSDDFREAMRRNREAIDRCRETIRRVDEQTIKIRFLLLDMQSADERAARSWEVEREDFLRRFDAL